MEESSDEPIRSALKAHERHAAVIVQLEERVGEIISELKDRGLQSPYLRSFVVARINPLRWLKGDDVPAAETVLETMLSRAMKFNVEKVRQQDLVGAYGPVDGE